MSLPTINDVGAVNPVLTNMLIGYQQADSRFVAMQAAPPVPVQNDSGTYYTFDKKYFFLDDLQERAPGNDFNNLPMGLSTATYTTLQYAGAYPVPVEVEANNQAPLSIEAAGVRRLANASLIRKERQFASEAMALSVWGTDDNNATTDWDDTVSGDPVADVQTAIDTIANATGYEANTLICGRIVAKALKLHPDIIDRVKYTQMAGQMSLDQALSEVLGLAVLVGKASYNSANEAQAFSGTAIIDDDALICHVARDAGLFTATALKTFVWNPGGGAGQVSSYVDEARDATVLKHKEQWDIKVVASDLGYFFADVV